MRGKMIKVIIADDEERICRLIQALVDWNAMGMEIVGTASNGIMALEQIADHQPDILITDIRMPGCNGLELIQKARATCPDLKIVIISGYAQFEYAQMALKYGVCEYLLKPINQKELTETIARIKADIEKRRKEAEDTESFRRGRENDIHTLRSMFLQDLLESPQFKVTEETLSEKYHLEVKPGCFRVFCVKFDVETGAKEEVDAEIIQDRLATVFESKLELNCYEWVFAGKGNYIYGMINYGTRQSDEIKEQLRGCLNHMEAQKKMLGNIVFSLGLGNVVKKSTELGSSLRAAQSAIYERLFEGTGKVLEPVEDIPVLDKKLLLEKYDRRICQAIELLDVEEGDMAVEELSLSVSKINNVHGWELLQLIRSAGDIFAMRADVAQKNNTEEDFYYKCDNCRNAAELFDALKAFQKTLMQKALSYRENEPSRPVRLAKQYIQNHYSEQITLEEVSEAIGLSPAYFSVLFKKETEVGFAKYLMGVRMEQAKVLLRETNLPVAEICKKVGYNDLKHFTHTFEKIAEVKPAVYRKLYG